MPTARIAPSYSRTITRDLADRLVGSTPQAFVGERAGYREPRVYTCGDAPCVVAVEIPDGDISDIWHIASFNSREEAVTYAREIHVAGEHPATILAYIIASLLRGERIEADEVDEIADLRDLAETDVRGWGDLAMLARTCSWMIRETGSLEDALMRRYTAREIDEWHASAEQQVRAVL